MAGDWLKMEASTPDKPEVLAITASMGWDDPDLTVGKLFRVWRWFDQQTTNGNAAGVTSALLDRIAGVSGFAQAMQKVGWLEVSEGGLQLPNFEKHNGATAKSRAQTAKRVASHRASDESNAQSNAPTVTPALAREEKRREEKKNCPKPRGLNVAGFPPGFDEFWSAYPKRQKRKDAVQAFAKLKPDPDFLKTMLSAIATQAASEQWRKESGKFIPLPASWLNGERWLDETTPTVGADPVLSELFRRGAA